MCGYQLISANFQSKKLLLQVFKGKCLLYFLILAIACKDSPRLQEDISAVDVGDTITFIDQRDSTIYKYITLGGRQWMSENLRFTTLEHSDFGAEDDIDNKQYGNYYAREKTNGICPKGWRVPDYEDIQALIRAIDGEFLPERGGKKVAKMALDTLNLQYGGFASLKNDRITHTARDLMVILNTVSDTIFDFKDEARKPLNEKRFSIGLHVYPANKNQDSMMLEPTYGEENDENLYNCRCVKSITN